MSKKLLGPEVSFVDILDLRLHDKSIEENQDRKRYFPLRPSSSGKCQRALAYALQEYLGLKQYPKEPKPGNVMRLLSFGHALEPDVIQHFRKNCDDLFKVRYEQQSVAAFTVNDETGTYPELEDRLIEGSMDFAFISDEHKCLVDLKSKKVKFSKFFSDNWEETDEMLAESGLAEPIGDSSTGWWIPDIEAFVDYLDEVDPFFAKNFWQLNFYASTHFAKSRGIEFACILQYAKNDSRMREIRFAPSDDLLERTRQRFQGAVDAVTEGNMHKAKREYMHGSISCAFCEFKTDCWKSKKVDAKQEYFDTHFPKKRWPDDITRLKPREVAHELEELYVTLQETSANKKLLELTEREITSLMRELGIWKIKFKDGKIWKLKELKKGDVLRRVKL